MPTVITVNNQKGGCSKSSIVLNLYYSLIRLGHSAIIIDADEQGTILSLHQEIETERPEVVPYSSLESWQEVREDPDYDFVLIDTPPYLTTELSEIFSVSDMVLFPLRASIADVLALDPTLQRFWKARESKASLIGAVVLVQTIHGTNYNDEAREVANTSSLPVLVTEMKMRVSYARSLAEPRGIFGANDEKAQAEFSAITREILNLLTVSGYGTER